jgi:hypothetical protein
MKKLIVSAVAIMLLAACGKKEGPAGQQGPKGDPGANGTGTTGSIQVRVKQFSQYGVPVTTNLNTATVSINGTNLSGVTDANGYATINNVSAGVYDLTIQRAGFGSTKQLQLNHPGSGTLNTLVGLSESPTFLIGAGTTIKDTVVFGNTSFKGKLFIQANSETRYALFALGTNSVTLDASNPNSCVALLEMNVSVNQASIAFSESIFNQIYSNLPSGTVIYAKVYPLAGSPYYAHTYYNPIADFTSYSGLGTPYSTILSYVKY